MACKKIFKPRGKAIASSLLTEQVQTIASKYPSFVLNKYNSMVPREAKIKRVEEITPDIQDLVVDDLLGYFTTPYFTSNFGEWEKEGVEIPESFVNENGEPLLKQDKSSGKFYHESIFGEKIFFPPNQNGLRSIDPLNWTNSTINDAVKVIAKKFFKRNFNLDYSDISFLAENSLEDEIKEIIQEKIDQEFVKNNGKESITAYDLKLSLNYTNEWAELMKTYFKSIGYKIEDEIDEDAEEGVVRKASYTKDSKSDLKGNVKILLSVMENVDATSTTKVVGIDHIFEEAPFVDFSDIYNTLLDSLHNITTVESAENNLVDPFEEMLRQIKRLAVKKPYLNNLLAVLEDSNYPKESKNQFFQAFYKAKNNFFVAEINAENEFFINYQVKNVTESNNSFNRIKNEWFENFKNTLNLGQNNESFAPIKEFIATTEKSLENFAKVPGRQKLDYIKNAISTFEKSLNKLGVTVKSQTVSDFFEQDLATENYGGIIQNILRATSVFNDYLEGEIGLNDNLFDTQSVFKELAKSKAFYEPNLSDNSINSAGKNYYGFSYPSHIQNEVNKWKASNGTYELKKATTYLGNEYSVLLNHLLATDKLEGENADNVSRNRLDKFKIGLFNVLQDKKTETKKSDPKDNTKLSKNDATVNAVNQGLRSVTGKYSTNLFYTPTPADKATAYMLEHDFFVETNLTIDRENKTYKFANNVLNIQFDYFKAEYKRMIQAAKEVDNDSVQKVLYYHTNKFGQTRDKNGSLVGNAFKSQTYPSLSPGNYSLEMELYNQDGSPSLTMAGLESLREDFKPFLNSTLNTRLKETLNRLELAEVLKKEEVEVGGEILGTAYKNRAVDLQIFSKYVETFGRPIKSKEALTENNLAVYNLVADFMVNTSINLLEYSKMFSGDPAYYKDMVDYAKRIPATYTDGLGPRIESKADQFYNISIINGVDVSSKYMDKLEKTLGSKIADKYSRISTTDAQSWITPARWEKLVRSIGNWTPAHTSALPKILGESTEPFTEKERKAVAQPLKGVYFSRDTENTENKGRPTYLKYSQAVLLPGLIKGSPLEKLYNKMVEQGIDEVVSVDGVKAGAMGVNTVHDTDGNLKEDFELSPYKLDNRGWKLQQDLPTKTSKDTSLGSQIQKNALMGVAQYLDEDSDNGSFDVNGTMTSGKDVYDGLNETIGELSNRGIDEIKKELGIDNLLKIKNVDGLYNLLLKDAQSKGLENFNLIQALQKNISIYGIPGSKEKLLNMFFAIVKDRAVKVKTNGGSLIQMSNFGIDSQLSRDAEGKLDYNSIGVKWLIDPEKGLKAPQIIDVEVQDEVGNKSIKQKVKPGQILLPGSAIAKYIPNWATMDANKLKKLIGPEILSSVIGYRIPNQGLASNDALEVVGFLPEGMGDAVVAYAEIPVKTGSDFDIDKMFMMLPSFYPQYRFSKSDLNHIRSTFKGKTIADTVELMHNTIYTLNDPDVQVEAMYSADTIRDTASREQKLELLQEASSKLISALSRGKTPEAKQLSEVLGLEKNEIYKLRYAKLKKDKDGEEIPVKEQSKDALKNKLIQYYKSIFTHPEVVQDVMTPIDFDFVKDHVQAMFPKGKTADLEDFDLLSQIDLKYLFIAGQAGVGMTANALVDFVRGLFYVSKINGFNINGDPGIHGGETKFDNIFSETLTENEATQFIKIIDPDGSKGYTVADIEKLKTAHAISALLNGFVDIAKDPFITRGNWATQTSSVGFLMLRSGLHPFKVNSFIAQPIIKEYIEYITTREAKIGKDVGDPKTKFMQKYLERVSKKRTLKLKNPTSKVEVEHTYQDLFNKLRKEKYNKKKKKQKPNYKEVLIKLGADEKLADSIIKEYNGQITLIGKVYNPTTLAASRAKETKTFNQVSKLNEFIGKENDYADTDFQLEVIQDFFDLLDKSKKMNDLAKSSKPDVSGPGKNLTSLMIIENLTQTLKDKASKPNEFANIEDRYELGGKKTILGHYFSTSIKETSDIINANPNLFFTGSNKVKTVFNDISKTLYKETLTNPELGDALNGEFYTYMMSGFKPLNTPGFYAGVKEKIVKAVDVYQNKLKAGAIKTPNFLLENLQIKSEIINEIKNGVKSEKTERYLVINSTLNADEVQNKLYNAWVDLLESDSKTLRTYGDLLIKYAFQQSGFNMNRSQFFTAIPHQFFVKNEFNKYMNEIDTSSSVFSNFSEQFFRHNWKNNALVPHITSDNRGVDMELSIKDGGIRGGFKFSTSSPEAMYKPFVKYGTDQRLAKFIGTDEIGQAIYMFTYKLGESNNYGNFNEYNFEMSPKSSNFAINNPSVIIQGNKWLKNNPPNLTEEQYYDRRFTEIPTDTSEEVPPGVEVAEQTVEVVDRYSNADLKANPNKIYVFGDNMTRKGKGGQAAIRGNENAVGIATKMQPNTAKEAYFKDSDLERNKERIDDDIRILKLKSERKTIVFPKDGLGTGLAKLKEKAPQTYEYLVKTLQEKFGFNNDTGQISQTGNQTIVEPGTLLDGFTAEQLGDSIEDNDIDCNK